MMTGRDECLFLCLLTNEFLLAIGLWPELIFARYDASSRSDSPPD